MRIILKMADGSEETCDVAEVGIQLGEWLLELTPGHSELGIVLATESRDDSHCVIAIRPGAANVLRLELEPHRGQEIKRKPKGA